MQIHLDSIRTNFDIHTNRERTDLYMTILVNKKYAVVLACTKNKMKKKTPQENKNDREKEVTKIAEFCWDWEDVGA